MSISFFLHSDKSEPVARHIVRDRMRELGWEIAFIRDWYGAMAPIATPNLTDGEMVIGWPAECPFAVDIRDAVESKDRQAIDRYYEDCVIGSCELNVSECDDIDRQHVEENLPEDMHPAQREYLRLARLHYETRTSGGRSPLSVDLQQALWKALGRATGGVMEDPFTGEYKWHHQIADGPTAQRTKVADFIVPEIPWWVIGLYAFGTIIALLLVISGRNPFELRHWYVALMLMQGPLALGLYLGRKPAWFASVVITGSLLLVGLSARLMGAESGAKPANLLISVYIIYALFRKEVRAHFEL